MSGVNVGTAYLEIVPSARGFAGKLQQQVGSAMASEGSRAGRTYGEGFSKSLKGIAAAVGGLFAVDKVKDFLGSSIEEARESQKVSALTAQVIKSTGGAANVSAAQIGNLATAISNKVGVDDEAIQSGANMLLTFKNIRNEAGKGNDIFNQSSNTMVDMAASMAAASGGQMNLRSASIQLGKALNDPVKGTTALSKVGVTFTDQQKAQIKTLVDSGKTMDAQKLILKELNSEFGGAAASQATAGEKAKVAWGNLKEQIGGKLLPLLDKAENFLTNKAIPAVSDFFTQWSNGTGTAGKIRTILERVAGALGTVIGWMVDNKDAVATFIGVLAGFAILKSIRDAFVALNIAMEANPIGLVVVAVAALAAGLVYAYKHSETFRDIVNGAFHMVASAAKFMWDGVLKPTFRFIINAWMTVVGAILHGAANAFGWVPKIGGKLKAAAAKFDDFRDSVNRALDGIHPVKEIHLKVTTSQIVANPSLAKPRLTIDGTRATGGAVVAGRSYLVGERGPELFAPKVSGSIIPNHKLSAADGVAGAGGVTVEIGTVQAHDYHDFMAQMQTRSRRASLDGVRR